MGVSALQALAWRLRRHHLERLDGGHAVDVVRRLCGVQAQVASAATLAVAVRQQQPDPDGTATGLERRDLVRTWAMRGTLHLLPTGEAADYLALLAGARTWTKGSWQKTFLTEGEMQRLADAVRQALVPGEPLTRDQLIQSLPPTLRDHVSSGWSAVLKPLAWQGLLCQGPAQGNRITFQRPDAWSPSWRAPADTDEDAAADRVLRAYLAAHGPATAERFDQWLMRGAIPRAKLRRWFADLGDDVTTVDVDGTPAHVLAEHEDELHATKPATAVRLLPGFDQWVLAPGTADPQVVPPGHRQDVSRAAGWIAPVVVAGGRVAGTWSADDGTPVVELFPDGGKVPAAKLKAETSRLAGLTRRRAPA